MIAKLLSARHLILQYSLIMCCTYVSHALECDYSCEDFRYIAGNLDDHPLPCTSNVPYMQTKLELCSLCLDVILFM